MQRTTGITEHEQLTQRKSKRPIECLVCMPWFCHILMMVRVHVIRFDDRCTRHEFGREGIE
jgi:hypothetical protein